MKKYMFGLFALALAVSFAAFTTAPVKFAPFDLKFQGTPTIQTSVELQTNWTDQAAPVNCTDLTNKACILRIDDQYVDQTVSPAKLKPSVTLVVSGNATIGFNVVSAHLTASPFTAIPISNVHTRDN